MEIFGATRDELKAFLAGLEEPSYRAKQLAEWIYGKGVSDFDLITNFSAELRRKLAESAKISRSKIVKRSVSRDGTTKFLLELSDGQRIESVLLPYEDRVTVCVSTQVGCPIGCLFCATGKGGFVRNLTAGEIIDQVLTLQSEGGRRVTNVVYMGMGEPLLNYDFVLKSVRILNAEVRIAMRKITISTVGIISRIKQLQEENLQLNLAISLHAPTDDLRREMIPYAESSTVRELVNVCKNYANATGRRVTYEYLLIEDVNDDLQCANALAGLLKGSLASVNLIPFNTVDGSDYKRSLPEAVNVFREVLETAGIETTQRFEKGLSVVGACGQLRANSKPKRG